MHNVDLGQIAATAEQAAADPDAGRMSVHLEGNWNVDPDDFQFTGDVPFPNGSVRFNADFPGFLGGGGRAPAPLAYCFYGAMCCYGATFVTQAAMAGVPIDGLKISFDVDVDFRTALGLGEFTPMSEYQFHLDVDSPASEEEVARVKDLTDERCPVIWAMNNPVPYNITVTKT